MVNFKQYLTEIKISLECHDVLNPKIWENEKIKPEVKQALLKFIDTWREFSKIPKSLVRDIIFTGGNANFNYTSKSDLDVHLIIDRLSIGTDKQLVDEYLQDKKTLWSLTHDVKIVGYSVEPYAQDYRVSFPKGQGVYSLKTDEWIQKPEFNKCNLGNDTVLKQKVKHYMSVIDHMIKNKVSVSHIKQFKNKLKDMRSSAIQRGGEYSLENLVFKELRNKGYLEKLNKFEKSRQDENLSL